MDTRLRRMQWPSLSPLRWRIVGRLVFPVAADPQRPGIRLNRYPHEVIGICVFCPGTRRYLSWVWPVKVVGVRLTQQQFEAEAETDLLAQTLRTAAGQETDR